LKCFCSTAEGTAVLNPNNGRPIGGVVLGVVDIAIFVVLLVAASHHGGSVYFHVG
jgi:hypothetical protein